MTRPHEALGLPQPWARKLPQGLSALNAVLALITVACGLAYIVLVNTATTKGYTLAQAQQRLDSLKTDTLTLQNKAETMTSMQQLTSNAAALGFVPVDKVQFVNPARKNYALAK